MRIASSWFVGTKKHSSFIAGLGVITFILLGNVLEFLRVHGGRSLLLSHDAVIKDPYLEVMKNDKRLVRSAQQQSKFLARRKQINDTLPMFFPRDVLFPTYGLRLTLMRNGPMSVSNSRADSNDDAMMAKNFPLAVSHFYLKNANAYDAKRFMEIRWYHDRSPKKRASSLFSKDSKQEPMDDVCT
jgi:hypothetical protein